MKGDHLGAFEELVLLAVHGLGDQAYGVAVQQLLERETGRAISLGPVYAALDRLEVKGVVRSEMQAGTPRRGGRSRRVFGLTADGVRALAALRRIRERLYGRVAMRSAGRRA